MLFRSDRRYGARHLKRAIERHLVQPLANLAASEQLHEGDSIAVDLRPMGPDSAEMCFLREAEGVPLPASSPARQAPMAAGASMTAAGRRLSRRADTPGK